MTEKEFRLGKYSLSLAHPHIMGIVNITPDSFYDGGRYMKRDAALRHAAKLAAEGASILDIGGESTRPGAEPVSAQEEIDRVLWLVEILCREFDLPVSVDTSQPRLMELTAQAGASLINDVRALSAPGALAAVAKTEMAVCLMHIRGAPQSMQQEPHYEDVTREVKDFLRRRMDSCIQAGIRKERIIVDPGFGFGKTPAHNCRLFAELSSFHELGRPLMVGLSRKSFLGTLTMRRAAGTFGGERCGLRLGLCAGSVDSARS